MPLLILIQLQQIQQMQYQNLNSQELNIRIKDLQSIGKLFSNRYANQVNPQEHVSHNNRFLNNRSLFTKSISTNTPRSRKLSPLFANSRQFTKQLSIGKIVSFNQNSFYTKKLGDTQKIEEINVSKSYLQSKDLRNNQHRSEQSAQQPVKEQQSMRQGKDQYIVGKIKDLSKLRSPNITIKSFSSQLPSIQKINKNVSVFKSFMGHSALLSSQAQRNEEYPVTLHNNGSAIISKSDPNYESALINHPKKQYVNLALYKYDTSQGDTGQGLVEHQIWGNFAQKQCIQKDSKEQAQNAVYARRFEYKGIHLPIKELKKQANMFPQKSKAKINQYQKTIGQKNVSTHTHINTNNNPFKNTEEIELSPKFCRVNSKINQLNYSRSKKDIGQSTIIGMQTSLATLKQILIQSKDSLDICFRIPDAFMKPPSTSANQKELQMLMVEVFNYVNLKPKTISIYKFSNCVMLNEKDLCILWHFNGKVYFGGWKNQTFGAIGDGKKHGLGLQWVPQRYVYYGEFSNGKKSGYGIMKKFNKEVYLGEWKENLRHGFGKVFQPEGGKLLESGQFYEGRHVKQGYLH